MNIIDAAHELGLNYPGGIKALALRMGMSPAVLTQKLNPNCHTHHLTIAEALKMQVYCNSVDITSAMAEELGYCLLPLPTIGNDDNLAIAIANSCREFGEFMGAVQKSISDNKVTPNERKAMEKELRETIASCSALLKIIK